MSDFNTDSDLLDFMADRNHDIAQAMAEALDEALIALSDDILLEAQEAMRELDESELQQLTSLKENFNVNSNSTSG